MVVADDCGRVIDRLSIEGQVDGATMQGIGAALLEERVYDLRRGRLANAGLRRLPRAPGRERARTRSRSIFVESDEPSFCYGHKGGGESPGIGTVVPAIANAVYDAVGIRLTSFPMTPDKVLAALADKDAAAGAAAGSRHCRTTCAADPRRTGGEVAVRAFDYAEPSAPGRGRRPPGRARG